MDLFICYGIGLATGFFLRHTIGLVAQRRPTARIRTEWITPRERLRLIDRS